MIGAPTFRIRSLKQPINMLRLKKKTIQRTHFPKDQVQIHLKTILIFRKCMKRFIKLKKERNLLKERRRQIGDLFRRSTIQNLSISNLCSRYLMELLRESVDSLCGNQSTHWRVGCLNTAAQGGTKQYQTRSLLRKQTLEGALAWNSESCFHRWRRLIIVVRTKLNFFFELMSKEAQLNHTNKWSE